MKTNFLYFREHGKHVTTVSGAYGGNQDFTLLDDSGANAEFAFDISADTEVKVQVTFKEDQDAKVGSAYSTDGAVVAGETVTVTNGGKSLDPKHNSAASHIDYHHRQTGGHNKSGGDQDRHRYQVAKKLGYNV